MSKLTLWYCLSTWTKLWEGWKCEFRHLFYNEILFNGGKWTLWGDGWFSTIWRSAVSAVEGSSPHFPEFLICFWGELNMTPYTSVGPTIIWNPESWMKNNCPVADRNNMEIVLPYLLVWLPVSRTQIRSMFPYSLSGMGNTYHHYKISLSSFHERLSRLSRRFPL